MHFGAPDSQEVCLLSLNREKARVDKTKISTGITQPFAANYDPSPVGTATYTVNGLFEPYALPEESASTLTVKREQRDTNSRTTTTIGGPPF
jgi:hypothetical protein